MSEKAIGESTNIEKVKGLYGGKLLDRHHDCTLRVQAGGGGIFDVIPLPEDREQAGCIWGGSRVDYYLMDTGRRIFAGEGADRLYREALWEELWRRSERGR
jgi:hypothetical protein